MPSPRYILLLVTLAAACSPDPGKRPEAKDAESDPQALVRAEIVRLAETDGLVFDPEVQDSLLAYRARRRLPGHHPPTEDARFLRWLRSWEASNPERARDAVRFATAKKP